MATTFTTGRLLGSRRFRKIHFGSVSTVPEVRFVTTISSKDRANARSPPARRAVERCGRVTYLNVCHPPASSVWGSPKPWTRW
jgi:hypothetical protein